MTLRVVLPLAGLLAGAVTTVQAHHSWSVDYDTSSTISVVGTVTEFVRWRPHSALTMAVEQSDGTVEQWTVEYGRGFQDAQGNQYEADYFQPGEALTVVGQPHRDESANHVRLRSVTRDSDGMEFESNRGRRDRGGRGNRRR